MSFHHKARARQGLSVVVAMLLPLSCSAAAWKSLGTSKDYSHRADCTFATCGDQLCLLGGRDWCGGDGCKVQPTDIYNTVTKMWTQKDGVPVEGGMHHFQAADDPSDPSNGCVWAGGAFKGPYPKEKTVDNIYTFCPTTGEWMKGPVIDRPRGSGGAFSYGGKYYLISGNVGGHGEHATVVPWFDCYDPLTKKWTTLEDIPHPRDHFTVAVLNDKLYVAGGRDTGVAAFFTAVEKTVDVYDLKTEKWSTLDSEYPNPWGGVFCAVHGDSIAYGGGEGGGTAWDNVYFLDGEKFTEGPSMPTKHHGTGFASCNGALWVAGGVMSQGGNPLVNTTEVLMQGEEVPACTLSTRGSPDSKMSSLLAEVGTTGKAAESNSTAAAPASTTETDETPTAAEPKEKSEKSTEGEPKIQSEAPKMAEPKEKSEKSTEAVPKSTSETLTTAGATGETEESTEETP